MALTQKEYSQRCYRKRKDNGLCPRCGKKLDREGHYCLDCLTKNREYRRESKIFYREHGICPCCGKEKIFGDEKQCIKCREKHYQRRKPLTYEQKEKYSQVFRKQQKNLYDERSEKGICTRCGKLKAVPGKKKCGICLEKDAFIHRKRHFDKKSVKEYRTENKLCYYCGDKVDIGKTICNKCFERCSENGKKSTSLNKYWIDENKIVFARR